VAPAKINIYADGANDDGLIVKRGTAVPYSEGEAEWRATSKLAACLSS
jgi:hypothetical protein